MSDVLKEKKTEQKGFNCRKFLPHIKNCEKFWLIMTSTLFVQIIYFDVEWDTRSLYVSIKHLSLSYNWDKEKYHELRFGIKSQLLILIFWYIYIYIYIHTNPDLVAVGIDIG